MKQKPFLNKIAPYAIGGIGGAGLGLAVSYLFEMKPQHRAAVTALVFLVGVGIGAWVDYSAPEKESGTIENPCSDNPDPTRRCYNPTGFCMKCSSSSGALGKKRAGTTA